MLVFKTSHTYLPLLVLAVFLGYLIPAAVASPNDDTDFINRMSSCDSITEGDWTIQASAYGIILEGPAPIIWDIRQNVQTEEVEKTEATGMRLVARFVSPDPEMTVKSLQVFFRVPQTVLTLPDGRSGPIFSPNTGNAYSALLFTRQNEKLCEQVGQQWVGRMFPELLDMPACRTTDTVAAGKTLQMLQNGQPFAMKLFLPVAGQWAPWYQGVLDATATAGPIQTALSMRAQDVANLNGDDEDLSTCYRRF